MRCVELILWTERAEVGWQERPGGAKSNQVARGEFLGNRSCGAPLVSQLVMLRHRSTWKACTEGRMTKGGCKPAALADRRSFAASLGSSLHGEEANLQGTAEEGPSTWLHPAGLDWPSMDCSWRM